LQKGSGQAWLKVHRLRKEVEKESSANMAEALQIQREAEKAKAIQIVGALSDRRHWSRDKAILVKRIHVSNTVLAFVGCFGTCLSLVQNEMVMSGYGSVFTLNFCKAVNSVCSVICVLLLVYIYRTDYRLRAVSFVLQLGQPARQSLNPKP
jgi:hypothetical protein